MALAGGDTWWRGLDTVSFVLVDKVEVKELILENIDDEGLVTATRYYTTRKGLLQLEAGAQLLPVGDFSHVPFGTKGFQAKTWAAVSKNVTGRGKFGVYTGLRVTLPAVCAPRLNEDCKRGC